MATTSKKKVIRSTDKKQTKKTDKGKEGTQIYKCVCCGAEFTKQYPYFLKNTSSNLYKANEDYIPICVSCLNSLYDDCLIKYRNVELATEICCSASNVPFVKEVLSEALNYYKSYTFSNYIGMYNKRQNNSGKNFISVILDQKGLNELDLRRSKSDDGWSKEETHSKEQVLKLLGYDPFRDYQDRDRRYLFTEFLKYLDDDELLSDTYKMSQILQLVNNNNQIKQCDMAISLLDPIHDMEEFKNLTSLKSNLVTSNDKIAKENRISVRNREGNIGGKGTITGLMREMREKDIDEIAANYYTQLQSPSSRWAAEVSAKALKENCFFDENDINDILYDQREMIQKLQHENDELAEKNRQLEQTIFINKKDGDA